MVDSSTQATSFVKGLDAEIKDIIRPTASVVTLNGVELVMSAAFDAKTKASLLAKQDDTKHHGPTRTAAARGWVMVLDVILFWQALTSWLDCQLKASASVEQF